MIRLDIKNYNIILTRKLQISTLRGGEILPTDQSRIIGKDCFTYSPLEQIFEKQIKTIENQLKTQTNSPREWKIIS